MDLENKVIHYCWFGKNKKNKNILKCIETWKRFFPDWEIKEWNESNFNVRICKYVEDAYLNKKWAFVSDYARLWILNKYGGLYFDTDVKILKEFDEKIKFPILAIECGTDYFINPGLIMGCNKNNEILSIILEEYNRDRFILKNGQFNQKTICERFTDLFLKNGFVRNDKIQYILGFHIYPTEYFCPINNYEKTKKITKNTYAVHLYLGSWLSLKQRIFNHFSYIKRRIFK